MSRVHVPDVPARLADLLGSLPVPVAASPPELVSVPCVVIGPVDVAADETGALYGPPFEVVATVQVMVLGQRTEWAELLDHATQAARLLAHEPGIEVQGWAWRALTVGTTTYACYDLTTRLEAAI